jgi:hypothetical protein
MATRPTTAFTSPATPMKIMIAAAAVTVAGRGRVGSVIETSVMQLELQDRPLDH